VSCLSIDFNSSESIISICIINKLKDKMKSYKQDQRGITHVLMLAGIAVLVLGVIGFAGFKIYKSKNDVKAKAYAYTTRPTSFSGVSAVGCSLSTPQNSGDITMARIYFKNNSNSVFRVGRSSVRPHSNSSAFIISYWSLINIGVGSSSNNYKVADAARYVC